MSDLMLPDEKPEQFAHRIAPDLWVRVLHGSGYTVETFERDILAAILDYGREERARGIEEAAREVNAIKQSAALAQERARSAGREGVATCRESDVETCERIEERLRALSVPGGASSPSHKETRHE